MTFDPANYLDPKFGTVPETEQESFNPGWYVVKVTLNDSRDIVAIFGDEHEQEAIEYVSKYEDLYLIPATGM